MSNCLNVYRSGRLTGVLSMRSGEPFYGFEYDDSYLSFADAMPLSLSLPLEHRRFSGGEALPFFEGLLPEGDVRFAVARQFHVSGNSPAQLIRVLGRDCAGDVMVAETDDPVQPPAQADYLPLPSALKDISENPCGKVSALRAAYRLSLAGGQEKVALYHDDRLSIEDGWYAPLNGSPSSHIVKPQLGDRFPLLALNEFLCMRAAAHMGIETAEVVFLPLENPVLVVRRYDREVSDCCASDGLAILKRVHQEDFCQALGYSSEEKYEGQKTFYARQMARLLLDYAARPEEALRNLYGRLAFSFLIGNCDAHLKNYSIVWENKNSVMLAPAYDLVSTSIYDGSFGAELSLNMGVRIGAHLHMNKVTADDFGQLAKTFYQSKRAAAKTHAWLLEGIEQAFDAAVADAQSLGVGQDAADLASRILCGAKKRSGVLRADGKAIK